MAELRLFYATNRTYLGDDRWRPNGYGKKFRDDGIENLRFGLVTVKVDNVKRTKYLETDCELMGRGDGERLIKYLPKCAEFADIVAYREKINRSVAENTTGTGERIERLCPNSTTSSYHRSFH